MNVNSERRYETRTPDDILWSKGHYSQKGINTDTLYFRNGKINAIIHHNTLSYEHPIAFCRIFNVKGEILYESEGDKILTPEKDNSECLYGFRNNKGDWAIPPQYENIKNVGLHYYIAYTTERAFLLNQQGEDVLSGEWDFLDILPTNTCRPNSTSRVDPNYYYLFPDTNLRGLLSALEFENSTLLKFRKNGKYGVVDLRGNIMLPPQYDNIRNHEAGVYEVKIGKKWGIIDEKGKILVQPNHFEVKFTNNPHLFITSDTTHIKPYIYQITQHGLANSQSQILLPNTYSDIHQINQTAFLLQDFNKSTNYLFDSERGFVVDTSIALTQMVQYAYFSVSKINPKTKNREYGMVNTQGETVIPMEYLEIRPFEFNPPASVYTLFSLKTKENKIGIYNIAKKAWLVKPEYDQLQFLSSTVERIELEGNYLGDIYCPQHHVAKRNNKWGVYDVAWKPILPDDFDYAGAVENVQSQYQGNNFLFLVKDKKLHFYTPNSFPLEADFRQYLDLSSHKTVSLKTYNGVELLIDAEGKLVVPPQYKLKSYSGDYTILQDTLTKKQKILSPDGSIKDFLPQYNVLKANFANDIVVVEDLQNRKVGVVNTLGKVIVPLENFAIVAPENDNVLWIRADFPNIRKDSFIYYNEFELNALDNNWRLCDLKGKPISDTIFKKPFPFYNNVGIGISNNKTGLWNIEGKMLVPPQYKHILRDTNTHFYYLVKEWADSSVTYGFADSSGQIVQQANFKLLSRFYNKYAFVITDNGQKGIIHQSGKWLCTPTPHSISNFQGSLIDTFLIANKGVFSDENRLGSRSNMIFLPLYLGKRLPFSIDIGSTFDLAKYYDSLSTESKRATFNCILDAVIQSYKLPSKYTLYERVKDSLCISSLFLNTVYQGIKEWGRIRKTQKAIYDELNIYKESNYYNSWSLLDFKSYNNFINLIIYNGKEGIKACNYLLKDSIWEELRLEDVLNLTPISISKLNTLLTNKIKELKKEDLDCGNGLSFFEISRNICSINQDGLAFYFNRKEGRYGRQKYGSDWNHVPVLLTWKELEPFIKNKP